MTTKMQSLARGLGLLVSLWTVLIPLNAQAACTQDDLTGVWFFNGVVSSLATRGTNETSICKVKFSSSGAVLTGSSSCTARQAFSTSNVNINGGAVTLNGACELRGNLDYCTNGFCSSIIINGARMDSEKSVISFLGFAEYSPAIIFDWSGVKKDDS